jgi:thiol:disulfide interchange protein
MKKFSILFAITALSIIGYFELSLFQAEKLFWLKLSM